MRGLVTAIRHHSHVTTALAELPQVNGRHRNLGLAAVRRARAVELLTSGCTYQQVADTLDYTSRGTAHNVVGQGPQGADCRGLGSLRGLENARLDDLQRALVGCSDDRGCQGRDSHLADRASTDPSKRAGAYEGRLRGVVSDTADSRRASNSMTSPCRTLGVAWPPCSLSSAAHPGNSWPEFVLLARSTRTQRAGWSILRLPSIGTASGEFFRCQGLHHS